MVSSIPMLNRAQRATDVLCAPTPLLCAKEVAMILGISSRTVTTMFRAGTIGAGRVNGKLWRTRQAKVEGYIEGCLRLERRLVRKRRRALVIASAPRAA